MYTRPSLDNGGRSSDGPSGEDGMGEDPGRVSLRDVCGHWVGVAGNDDAGPAGEPHIPICPGDERDLTALSTRWPGTRAGVVESSFGSVGESKSSSDETIAPLRRKGICKLYISKLGHDSDRKFA